MTKQFYKQSAHFSGTHAAQGTFVEFSPRYLSILLLAGFVCLLSLRIMMQIV
ncbi:MAG: hypothetical protein Q4F17_03280 [Eubacteriales bacterium]|nr:hypothetical protein [Eubacteriales bacterium]